MTNTERRYVLMITEHGVSIYGWKGYVFDKKLNMKHPLSYTYVDYELDGERGYGSTSAFDTREQLVAAARKKAHQLVKRA